MLDATIAVITFKRPLWLERLLEELNKQELDDKYLVEILVVDNDCGAKIKSIVEEISSRSKFNIRYECEKNKGIVAARNKCVEVFLSSNSKNLIFIDDDEWPQDRFWAKKMLDEKTTYSADIVTSKVISVGEEGTPEWAVSLIYGKNPYREGDPVDKFYTNNLLIDRRVLETVSPAFDTRFAMTGASDYHFSLKCSNLGFRAVYINAPVVEEFPKSRANIRWFVRRGFRSGIGYTRSHIFEEKFVVAVPRCAVLSLIRLIRGVVNILLGVALLQKLKIVDGLFRVSSSFGTIAGFFGIKYYEYSVVHGR